MKKARIRYKIHDEEKTAVREIKDGKISFGGRYRPEDLKWQVELKYPIIILDVEVLENEK